VDRTIDKDNKMAMVHFFSWMGGIKTGLDSTGFPHQISPRTNNSPLTRPIYHLIFPGSIQGFCAALEGADTSPFHAIDSYWNFTDAVIGSKSRRHVIDTGHSRSLEEVLIRPSPSLGRCSRGYDGFFLECTSEDWEKGGYIMKNAVHLIMAACILAAVSEGAVAARESDKKAGDESADTQQRAHVYCSNSETKLKNKVSAWGNGIFMDVPEEYSGWNITQMEEDTKKQPLKVRVKKSGIVTLAIEEKRAKHYLVAEEWTKVGGFTIHMGKPYTFIIMEKYLEEGKYEFRAVGPHKNLLRHPLLLTEK
jgi:hypothetical protein